MATGNEATQCPMPQPEAQEFSLSHQELAALHPVFNTYSGGFPGSDYKALVEVVRRSQ